MKNPLPKNRFNWLIALLLFANVFTLGFFWWNNYMPPISQDKGPRAFLIKELQLSNAQQKKYEVLIQEHQQLVRELKRKTGDARERLYELLKETPRNDSAEMAHATQFCLLIREMELVNLHHFEQLRNLCDESQKKKFDEILHQLPKMMMQNNGKDSMPPPRR